VSLDAFDLIHDLPSAVAQLKLSDSVVS
jgi:hypothetical protein